MAICVGKDILEISSDFIDELARTNASVFDSWAVTLEKIKKHVKTEIQKKVAQLLENDPQNPCFQEVTLFGPMDYGRLETAHTRTLAWLFDPKAPHGFRDKLVTALLADLPEYSGGKIEIKKVLSEKILNPGQKEKTFGPKNDKSGRIDLWIEGKEGSQKLLVVIEAKIDASESFGQLKKYDVELKKWEDNNYVVRKVYLTTWGDIPETSKQPSTWHTMQFSRLANILWAAGRCEATAERPPGYEFLRLYIAGILRDILGLTLPMHGESNSPYEALQFLQLHSKEIA